MAFVPLDNPGEIGVLNDYPAEDAPPNAWTSAKDVNFKEGRMEKAQGWSEIFSSGNTGEKTLWFFPWNDGSTLYWVYTTPNSIFRAKDGNREEITREDNNGNDVDYNSTEDSVFSGGVFNGVPIVNNDSLQDYPQQWDAGNKRMKDLDNWPSNLYCKFIQPFQNFLVAYNLNDNGTALPMSLQWSDVADPGTVPGSWDITDPTVLAGRTSLAQTGGEILGAKALLNENIIYKRDAIINMRFSGGNFIFNFDYISEEEGILAPHSVASLGDRHVFVSRGDVKLNDGRSLESIIRGKNRRWLFNSMNDNHSDKTYLVNDFLSQELWICFTSAEEDPNAKWPNLALVWDYGNDTWTVRSLPGAAFSEHGIVFTSQGSQIWNDQSDVWNDVSRVWGEQLFDPNALSILSTETETGKFFDLNSTFLQDGNKYKSYAQRVGAPVLDEVERQTGDLNPTRNKLVRRVYPQVKSPNPVKMRLGMQRIYGGAIDWMPTFTFDPSTDRHIDTRLNGKYFAIEIQQEEASDFKFTGIHLEFETLGEGVR